MQTVLLTGATGFLGSKLFRQLIISGYKVAYVRRSTSNLRRIAGYERYGMPYDDVDLQRAFEENAFSAVIHLATSYDEPSSPLGEQVKCNLELGLILLRAAEKYQVPIFINTDTFFSEGGFKPALSPYVVAKRHMSEWMRVYSQAFDCVNLKLFHVFGPDDSKNKFFPWLVRRIMDGGRIQLTHGKQLRDFVYVDDVVDALMVILEQRHKIQGYKEFDVGTGTLSSVRDAVECVFNNICKPSESEVVFAFGEKSGEEEVSSRPAKIEPLGGLGWHPRHSLLSGVQSMLRQDKIFERQGGAG